MDDDIAIELEHVSKKFTRSLRRSMLYGVKDVAKNAIGLSSHSQRLRKGEFFAVDDVSLEVRKGETLGLIGPNGSGKSTILKMINGIYWPDRGKIAVKGRVGALIEVGAGFHPMLSGRENIYVNAAILGMTKREVDERFDSIVAFADIGDFIDSPVKFYSSGMYVRLGFAVAVNCQPDVLLLDEVLAVGDIGFQNKCLKKIQEILDRTTVVFVSHNLNSIKMICDRCVVLSNGRIAYLGNTTNAISEYARITAPNNDEGGGRYSSETIEIEILDGNGRNASELAIHGDYRFRFKVKQLSFKQGFLLAFAFVNLSINYSYRVEVDHLSHLKGEREDAEFEVKIDKISLPPGCYTIRVAVSDGTFLNRIYLEESTIMFHVMETEGNLYLDPAVVEIRR